MVVIITIRQSSMKAISSWQHVGQWGWVTQETWALATKNPVTTTCKRQNKRDSWLEKPHVEIFFTSYTSLPSIADIFMNFCSEICPSSFYVVVPVLSTYAYWALAIQKALYWNPGKWFFYTYTVLTLLSLLWRVCVYIWLHDHIVLSVP